MELGVRKPCWTLSSWAYEQGLSVWGGLALTMCSWVMMVMLITVDVLGDWIDQNMTLMTSAGPHSFEHLSCAERAAWILCLSSWWARRRRRHEKMMGKTSHGYQFLSAVWKLEAGKWLAQKSKALLAPELNPNSRLHLIAPATNTCTSSPLQQTERQLCGQGPELRWCVVREGT